MAYKRMADKADVAQRREQYAEQIHEDTDRRTIRKTQEQNTGPLFTRASIGFIDVPMPYPMPRERAEAVALGHGVLGLASALGVFALVISRTDAAEWAPVAMLAWLGLWMLVTILIRRRTADTPQAVEAREQYAAQRAEEKQAVQHKAQRREQERE